MQQDQGGPTVEVSFFLIPEEESENYYARGGFLYRRKSAGPEPESCKSTMTIIADTDTINRIIAEHLRTTAPPAPSDP